MTRRTWRWWAPIPMLGSLAVAISGTVVPNDPMGVALALALGIGAVLGGIVVGDFWEYQHTQVQEDRESDD